MCRREIPRVTARRRPGRTSFSRWDMFYDLLPSGGNERLRRRFGESWRRWCSIRVVAVDLGRRKKGGNVRPFRGILTGCRSMIPTSLVVDLRGDGSHGGDRLVQTTAFDYDCDRPGASRDKELIVKHRVGKPSLMMKLCVPLILTSSLRGFLATWNVRIGRIRTVLFVGEDVGINYFSKVEE